MQEDSGFRGDLGGKEERDLSMRGMVMRVITTKIAPTPRLAY